MRRQRQVREINLEIPHLRRRVRVVVSCLLGWYGSSRAYSRVNRAMGGFILAEALVLASTAGDNAPPAEP